MYLSDIVYTLYTIVSTFINDASHKYAEKQKKQLSEMNITGEFHFVFLYYHTIWTILSAPLKMKLEND